MVDPVRKKAFWLNGSSYSDYRKYIIDKVFEALIHFDKWKKNIETNTGHTYGSKGTPSLLTYAYHDVDSVMLLKYLRQIIQLPNSFPLTVDI